MTRVLVTGATGFVGRAFCQRLTQSGYCVRAALRKDEAVPVAEKVVVGDIGGRTDWDAALSGVDVVVHLAARAHVLNDPPGNAQRYFDVNEIGTMRLAEAAARAGVRRFVFLSSIKVNGESTTDRPFSAIDSPHPQDAYGTSKWHAERGLLSLAAAGDIEAVIVRPPLVYGPHVRANFLRLLQWVDRGRPLPLGAVTNRRSLVSIWNLCDLMENAMIHPAAANRVWMVSDGEDVSTPTLIRHMATAMHRRVKLLPIPMNVLRAVGFVMGRGGEITRLCGSLTVDVAPTVAELGWTPPVKLFEGVQRTVDWYLSEARPA